MAILSLQAFHRLPLRTRGFEKCLSSAGRESRDVQGEGVLRIKYRDPETGFRVSRDALREHRRDRAHQSR
jgi:hypothetical protein